MRTVIFLVALAGTASCLGCGPNSGPGTPPAPATPQGAAVKSSPRTPSEMLIGNWTAADRNPDPPLWSGMRFSEKGEALLSGLATSLGMRWVEEGKFDVTGRTLRTKTCGHPNDGSTITRLYTLVKVTETELVLRQEEDRIFPAKEQRFLRE